MGWRTGLGPVPMASLQSEAEAGLGLCRACAGRWGLKFFGKVHCVVFNYLEEHPPRPPNQGAKRIKELQDAGFLQLQKPPSETGKLQLQLQLLRRC